jgi:hypothetical protein
MTMAANGVTTKVNTDGPAPGSGAIRLPVRVLQEMVQHRRWWWAKAPIGATREDAIHPSFWVNVAKQLTRHDIVTLLAFDESWELEVCVETVRQSGVDVSVRKNYARTPLNMAGTPIGEDYRTEYRATDGWCVVRTKDGAVIIRGCSLEVSAINQFHREQPKVPA